LRLPTDYGSVRNFGLEGMPEGQAIRIAIAKVREWAGHHGVASRWH
jgi:hypothetical protein